VLSELLCVGSSRHGRLESLAAFVFTPPGPKCQSQFQLLLVDFLLCLFELLEGSRFVPKPQAWQGQEMTRGQRQSRLQPCSGADLFCISCSFLAGAARNKPRHKKINLFLLFNPAPSGPCRALFLGDRFVAGRRLLQGSAKPNTRATLLVGLKAITQTQ
jgi:hypothetical protein